MNIASAIFVVPVGPVHSTISTISTVFTVSTPPIAQELDDFLWMANVTWHRYPDWRYQPIREVHEMTNVI